MSFTDKELQIIDRVKKLSTAQKTAKKKVAARRLTLERHTAKTKKYRDALISQSKVLEDIESSLRRLKEQLFELIQKSIEESKQTNSNETKEPTLYVPASYYELRGE